MQQLKALIQLIPLLIDLIKYLESALPESGRGQQKLQFIKEFLQSVYPELNDNWSTIEKTVSLLVGLFNQVGSFKKS